MENILSKRFSGRHAIRKKKGLFRADSLAQGDKNTVYVIKEVDTEDTEMKDFLFTLGCYPGEDITIVSCLAGNMVVSIKDARYSIDMDLAKAIII
jgi:ferrous iron transport protein A